MLRLRAYLHAAHERVPLCTLHSALNKAVVVVQVHGGVIDGIRCRQEQRQGVIQGWAVAKQALWHVTGSTRTHVSMFGGCVAWHGSASISQGAAAACHSLVPHLCITAIKGVVCHECALVQAGRQPEIVGLAPLHHSSDLRFRWA